EVSRRLRQQVESRNTVARLSSDEFVILLNDIDNPEEMPGHATAVLTAFETPFRVDGGEMNITASVGMSISPGNGEDYNTLLRNADIAMYRAKQFGTNQFRFYTNDMNALALQRVDLEARLRRAVDG